MMAKESFPEYLKIGTVPAHYPLPTYAFKINENKTFYFADTPVIKILSRMLNFEPEIIIPEDGQYGELSPDGNWTGVVGLLMKGQADLGISTISITHELAPYVYFSTPYLYSSWTFITDKPRYSHTDFAILNPFSSTVWLLVGITLLLILAISLIFEKSRNSSILLLNIYGSLLQNMAPFHTRKLSTNLFIFLWVIAAFFLSESYKAIILSSLTFPTQTGVRTIEDLGFASGSKSFKCSTFKGIKIEITSRFRDSDDVKMKNIGDCLNRSDMFNNDIAEFIQPRTYQKAFIGLEVYLDAFRDDYFVSEDSFFTNMMGIAAQKSFCCKETLDRAVLKIFGMGLVDKFQSDITFFRALLTRERNAVDIHLEELNSRRKLSLKDFDGAFFCLISGHILSSVVLVVEIVLFRKSKIKYCCSN